jgi:hypothetical protein
VVSPCCCCFCLCCCADTGTQQGCQLLLLLCVDTGTQQGPTFTGGRRHPWVCVWVWSHHSIHMEGAPQE